MRPQKEELKKPPFYPWVLAAVLFFVGGSQVLDYVDHRTVTIFMAGRAGAVYSGGHAFAIIAMSLLVGLLFLSYGIYLRVSWQKHKRAIDRTTR